MHIMCIQCVVLFTTYVNQHSGEERYLCHSMFSGSDAPGKQPFMQTHPLIEPSQHCASILLLSGGSMSVTGYGVQLVTKPAHIINRCTEHRKVSVSRKPSSQREHAQMWSFQHGSLFDPHYALYTSKHSFPAQNWS